LWYLSIACLRMAMAVRILRSATSMVLHIVRNL
jgi:hypothetical protein